MKLNKKRATVVIIIMLVTIVAVIGTGFKIEAADVYKVMKLQLSGTNAPESAITEETIVEERVALEQLAEEIWASALEHHNIKPDDWVHYTLKDFSTIDESAPIHFRRVKETNSSNAVYHESLFSGIQNALLQHIQKGDSKPLFLVHTTLREVKITFQRDYGQGEYVVLTLKEQNDEKKMTKVVKIADENNTNHPKLTETEIEPDQVEQTETLRGVFWSDITVTTESS